MNLRSVSTVLPLLALLAAPSLSAQGGPMAPPPYMLIYREAIKPGHEGAHQGTETAWARVLAHAKATSYYLGMASLTGPSEAWYVEGFGSFGEWEAKRKELDARPEVQKELRTAMEQDGEHVLRVRSFLAKLHPELAYGPPVEIGKMRYFRIRLFRLKPGQAEAFEGAMKQALGAYEKIRFPGSFRLYEVVSGMGGPAYFSLYPMASLAEMDAFEAQEKEFRAALGDEAMAALGKAFAGSVANMETFYFAFDPRLTFASPALLASDPGFWTVKEGQ